MSKSLIKFIAILLISILLFLILGMFKRGFNDIKHHNQLLKIFCNDKNNSPSLKRLRRCHLL